MVGDKLVIVTTDRQSAFDRLLASIPFKVLREHHQTFCQSYNVCLSFAGDVSRAFIACGVCAPAEEVALPCAGAGAEFDERLVDAKHTAPHTKCASGCAPPQRVHHAPLQGLSGRGGCARLHDRCLALTSPPTTCTAAALQQRQIWPCNHHIHPPHWQGQPQMLWSCTSSTSAG